MAAEVCIYFGDIVWNRRLVCVDDNFWDASVGEGHCVDENRSMDAWACGNNPPHLSANEYILLGVVPKRADRSSAANRTRANACSTRNGTHPTQDLVF